MATSAGGEQDVNSVTFTAGSAITVNRFIKVASDGEVDHAASAQGAVNGVSLQAATAQGQAVPCAKPDGGIVYVEAGAAISLGADAATDSSGRVITYVSGTVNNKCWGTVLRAAGAAGEIVPVQFFMKATDGGT